MRDKDDLAGPRLGFANIPDWLKFSVLILSGAAGALIWIENRFVARVEWTNHIAQQAVDMSDLKHTQARYADAERVTASGVYDLKVDMAEVKGDVGWIRQYLDVSMPPPKKNGRKVVQ